MRFTFFSLIFLVSFVHLLTTVPTLGQETGLATLEGTVLDAETKKPVTGALITLEGIVDGRFFQPYRIGPTGRFKFLLDPKKNYYILASAAGYQSTQEKFIITSPYAFRVSGKMILLKKGQSVMPPPTPSVAQTAPAVSSTSAATLAGPTAATPPPLATAPVTSTTTAAPAATTRAEPASPATTSTTALTQPNAAVAPPRPGTARTGPVINSRPGVSAPIEPVPAPPVTVQTVRAQLQAVQFVQSKAELVPESRPALDQLLTFMRENPGVSIELAGHTDNQGNFDENLTLSTQRVDLVKTFLVTNGIAADRIRSRGYGSTRPITSNKSEETRRLNRRVEMIILTK